MTGTPRWLQRIKQRDRGARPARDDAREIRPYRARASSWIAIATLFAAASGIIVTWYFVHRSEEAEIQEQYSSLIVQTYEDLPKMRAFEERISDRLADIKAALETPELTNQERECLENLRIMGVGEFGEVQSVNRKLNERASNSTLDPPPNLSASDLAKMRREQRIMVDLFAGPHAERYAEFNSERVRECTEGPN